MIKVKTTYNDNFTDDNITEYASKEEADMAVKTCLKWGLGIKSCEIINEKEL